MSKKKYTQRRKPLKGGGKTSKERKTRKEAFTLLKETYSPTTARNIVEEWTKSRKIINEKYPNESSSKKKKKIKEKFAESMRKLDYNVTLKNKSKSPKSKKKSPKPKSPKSKNEFLRMFSKKK